MHLSACQTPEQHGTLAENKICTDCSVWALRKDSWTQVSVSVMPCAGKLLTEGVDPSRDIWQNWQDLRGSSAEHWYPGGMKVVAFVFNKVRHNP